jgi:starch phosphorylase
MNALHALILYQELKQNPSARDVKRMIFFSGKAAPGYKAAKDIIRFIYCLSRKIFNDPHIRDMLRIVFIPNYNVSVAEKIIPAADLSEQISTAGMEASGTGNMKLTINGALTICTDDGANVEMREHIGDAYWPFKFGKSASEIESTQKNKSYNPDKIYSENPRIAKALEALRDRSLAENEAEHETLCDIYTSLLEGAPHSSPDKYFVLADLEEYYNTQKKVEALYKDPHQWAQYALFNISGMGSFSSDVSIKNYAEEIWHLTQMPLAKEELDKLRHEYSELDRCRILPPSK